MVQELVKSYEQRLDAFMKQIEENCSNQKKKRRKNAPPQLTSPNYIADVLLPVFQEVARIMPRSYGRVHVPNPEEYMPIKEFFRIKVGLQTVGGFLVPDGESFDLYFVPLKSALPVSDKVKVESVEHLKELLIKWYTTYKYE